MAVVFNAVRQRAPRPPRILGGSDAFLRGGDGAWHANSDD